MEDCFDKGLVMPFEHVKRTYVLPNQTFLCFSQLTSFLRATLGPKITLLVMNDVERLLYKGGGRYLEIIIVIIIEVHLKMYCLLLNEGVTFCCPSPSC